MTVTTETMPERVAPRSEGADELVGEITIPRAGERRAVVRRTGARQAPARAGRWPGVLVVLAVAAWVGAYSQLGRFADWLTYDVFDLARHTHIASSVDFFADDVPKIFLLLAGIIPLVSVVRSYIPPEKVKKVVNGKGEFVGTVLAALLGTVTPFCSCSAVPMFIGFVESGLPLAVTFGFLIASPVVNEVALALLAGLFGVRIALLYVGLGLVVAIAGGTLIGWLRLESQVEGYVFDIRPEGLIKLFGPS